MSVPGDDGKGNDGGSGDGQRLLPITDDRTDDERKASREAPWQEILSGVKEAQAKIELKNETLPAKKNSDCTRPKPVVITVGRPGHSHDIYVGNVASGNQCEVNCTTNPPEDPREWSRTWGWGRYCFHSRRNRSSWPGERGDYWCFVCNYYHKWCY